MNILQKIRETARKNKHVRLFIANKLVPLGFFDSYFKNYEMSGLWQQRLKDTIDCPDNKSIPRVKNAGNIINGKQIMHNGLKINLGSYYGPEVSKILYENKGVHEPQEERVFAEVLKRLPEKATMIELGSFWSFYSMWFNSQVKVPTNYMIEPDSFNMTSGKSNFKLNKLKGDFTQAFIGKKSQKGNPNTVCIDDFAQDKNIKHIDILHSDIQGFEYDMLLGSQRLFDEKRISYIFISTHSNEVHEKCLQFLKKRNFFIIANSDKDDTYSEDGLIAGHSPDVTMNTAIPIALKTKAV